MSVTAQSYSLVVIGSGVAGLTAASICRAAGRSVAVIDERPLGGTCALRGCDPKRVLMAAAEATDAAKRLKGYGVTCDVRISWPELMAFKRTFTEPVPAAREEELAREGIDVIRGTARFSGPDRLDVNGRAIEAEHILLAVGSRPAPLHIAGEDLAATSEDFLDLDELPKRIVFLGGGYIAAECSNLAARAGAAVTILQREERILAHFDPDLVDMLSAHMRALGIVIETRAVASGIERAGKAFAVKATRNGQDLRIEADLVVHAGGRVPDLARLDLPFGNVATERGRLVLNEFLQSTTNSAVYAAGDAASVGPPLTPIAGRDGRIAAENILKGNVHRLDKASIPSVVFTIPPLAAIGMSELETRTNAKVRTNFANSADWYTARRLRETASGHKVMIDEATGRILGAHLLGPHADEVINLFALAMESALTAEQVKDIVLGYPTGGSDLAHMLK
jgi:glutathione reductase (NADPH)